MVKRAPNTSIVVSWTQLSAAFVAMAGALSFMFFQYSKAQDAAIASAQAETEYYRKALDNAVQTALDTANFYRKQDDLPPIIVAAPVIPLSQSPSSKFQRMAAELQTSMATIEKIKREVGLPPTPTPPQAVESDE